MNEKEKLLIRLLDSDEPIAIVRYFEWFKTDRHLRDTKYSVLRLDTLNKDIDEFDVPRSLYFFLALKLHEFKKMIDNVNGQVFERNGFRDIAISLVHKRKIKFLIDKNNQYNPES
ncbi:hypothetical protein LS482_16070 [Sinomicrobium kalidii]|uniref:hypothetical protein n=1 Tax=Sinomicrobium kalidii TaxID=2900738 RepID=UPI001E45DDCE|nr:hypothetical protein [Sinomicrobium kalidii]UGU15189.1 hypothetical protein LS482_16070 [Sinomicrobium kalidii]